MQLIRLEAAVILGIVLPQISSIGISPSDCLATVKICMSDLCRTQKALDDDNCADEGCQIKASEVCNMTIQAILGQFPSLRGCLCAQEEERCDSVPVLATQCLQKPATQQKRSQALDWKSSGLIGYVHDGSGSCLEHITRCISDTVCNKYMTPVLQVCTIPCDQNRCRETTQQFYRRMPQNVADMLVMCECEVSDEECLQVKAYLPTGTCGAETWKCQDTVKSCVQDQHCRKLLNTFRADCWRAEEAQCPTDLHMEDCFTYMNPASILGGDSRCKAAFLATLGTVLHYPCTCEEGFSDGQLLCNIVREVFHNRTHFIKPRKSSTGPSKPPEFNETEKGPKSITDYLFYAVAFLLLIGAVPLAVFTKIWISRKRENTKFHPLQKGNCVVIH
ncbi:GDNF family receptor alpha-like [Sphaeramia orbicularis]|uniref:GDNF family receptor alpha-like n=1 Tax=Sphaeramia orbicularis TaxID=375764 RepID=UPI00117EB8F1|nr:GDNF family receptor alpha-like [Sphaeramia orbicularis]